MYTQTWPQLNAQSSPIDLIVVGLGFMGFGFISNLRQLPNIRVPLIITRRPSETVQFLIDNGYPAEITDSVDTIHELADRGIYAVSDNLDLIAKYDNKVVFEVTGTVDYGTQIALLTVAAGKHLVTMNPELQATVGTPLKALFDQKQLLISDVAGDQPGSLARLIASSKLKGFKPLIAGNMKRYLDRHATQEQMMPWAKDKGLAVRQTVSFTDGTKQSIEMTLVANYFGFGLIQPGMAGPEVQQFDQALNSFDWEKVPANGAVDYMLGKQLFPGVFLIAEHNDLKQQKYLRYLNMGDGPRYLLFDSYHLCHLEAPESVLSMLWTGDVTINNGSTPVATTATFAKRTLTKGSILDGIGGDTVYGNIQSLENNQELLPVGLSKGAELLVDVSIDQPIRLQDVKLPKNSATIFLGLA